MNNIENDFSGAIAKLAVLGRNISRIPPCKKFRPATKEQATYGSLTSGEKDELLMFIFDIISNTHRIESNSYLQELFIRNIELLKKDKIKNQLNEYLKPYLACLNE